MAANAKPLRKKMKEAVAVGREHIKKIEPNKKVRTEKSKKAIEEHYKHAKKSSKNSQKAMLG